MHTLAGETHDPTVRNLSSSPTLASTPAATSEMRHSGRRTQGPTVWVSTMTSHCVLPRTRLETSGNVNFRFYRTRMILPGKHRTN